MPFLQKLLLCLWMAVAPSLALACGSWPSLPYESMRALSLCAQPPVERRVGELCLRHEWLCGDRRFESWFEHWMREMNEPFRLERRLGQLIFSAEQQKSAWALFWFATDQSEKGFAVLFSRLRVSPEKDNQP